MRVIEWESEQCRETVERRASVAHVFLHRKGPRATDMYLDESLW